MFDQIYTCNTISSYYLDSCQIIYMNMFPYLNMYKYLLMYSYIWIALKYSYISYMYIASIYAHTFIHICIYMCTYAYTFININKLENIKENQI